jgi:NAD-dependent dihydropyrimidine dehydrogenase PreA subunit
MTGTNRILYCHCAHARVVPNEVKNAVLEKLSASGVEFEAVPDLCEMAARGDGRLKECASDPSLKIAACYPRAVKWLFAAAGATLPDPSAQVLNMRTQTADEVVDGLMNGNGLSRASASESRGHKAAQDDGAGRAQALGASLDEAAKATPAAKPWKPWFPVIDYTRCTNCMQCLSFCLFDVYGVSGDKKIQVQNQTNCKTDCPACSRVCPEVAIMFPKYRHGPINGDEVAADDVRREAMKVDISALLGGDVYALLRDRSVKAKSRFSKERDDERALKERQTCLITLQKDLDIPPEVLATLPSIDQIRAKADAAHERARQAMEGTNPADES